MDTSRAGCRFATRSCPSYACTGIPSTDKRNAQVHVLRSLRGFWRAETGLFFALWLLLLVGGRSRLFRDPGTFWHTVVGEQIISTGEFRDTDSFSYTFAGQHWIPHQWLGE